MGRGQKTTPDLIAYGKHSIRFYFGVRGKVAISHKRIFFNRLNRSSEHSRHFSHVGNAYIGQKNGNPLSVQNIFVSIYAPLAWSVCGDYCGRIWFMYNFYSATAGSLIQSGFLELIFA